jgi:hypothetical protein
MKTERCREYFLIVRIDCQKPLSVWLSKNRIVEKKKKKKLTACSLHLDENLAVLAFWYKSFSQYNGAVQFLDN